VRGLTFGLLLLLGGAGDSDSDTRRPGVGDVAPPLELQTPDGRPFPRSHLTDAGSVTVVDFVATWCRPCHAALGDLAAVRHMLGPRVRLILVDVSEDPATVRRFVAGTTLPEGAEVALDVQGVTSRRWGQDRFPTTFLVDKTGVIRHINRGWGPGYRERMLRWLRAMLPQ
jgi:cytochrome c biogenesis protein CcmG/thiol:disulfide interchange protein DsbE